MEAGGKGEVVQGKRERERERGGRESERMSGSRGTLRGRQARRRF